MDKFADDVVVIAALKGFQCICLAVKVNAEISGIVEDKSYSRKSAGAADSCVKVAPRLGIVALGLSACIGVYVSC